MAIATNYMEYIKKCPVCNGIAKKYKTEYSSFFFGLIGYEKKIEIWRCKSCDGKGYIKPKKIIVQPDKWEPKIIY